jgi:hypothetical protein
MQEVHEKRSCARAHFVYAFAITPRSGHRLAIATIIFMSKRQWPCTIAHEHLRGMLMTSGRPDAPCRGPHMPIHDGWQISSSWRK